MHVILVSESIFSRGNNFKCNFIHIYILIDDVSCYNFRIQNSELNQLQYIQINHFIVSFIKFYAKKMQSIVNKSN